MRRVVYCYASRNMIFFSCRLFAPKHLWDLTVRAKVWNARIMIYSSSSSFSQNKYFGLDSSDLGCLLFLGDWSFNVFFSLPSVAFWLVYWPQQVWWTKSPASVWMPSCSRSLARFMLWLPFSPRMTVFLVEKILFAADADLFWMPLTMRNNYTMNVQVL